MKRQADKIYSLFWKQSRIVFICPVTLKPVRCGPTGDGYYIKVPTRLLKGLAPVSWGLAFLRMALATQGLGGVIPVLSLFPPSSYSNSINSLSTLQSIVQTMSFELSKLQNIQYQLSNTLGSDPLSTMNNQVQ